MTAEQEWKQAIAAKRAAGMSFNQAAAAVAQENPGLRERYVAEFNRSHRTERR